MTEIASAATPQLGSLLPLVVRPRRWRSPKYAPGAYHHRLHREKSDPIADRTHPFAMLHPSKSTLMLVATPHQNTPATLKSP
jgi:hypothetical protein